MQPFDYPWFKARAKLRVDTERRFIPVPKAGASAVSSAERFSAVEVSKSIFS
jgi:hypothetical protein